MKRTTLAFCFVLAASVTACDGTGAAGPAGPAGATGAAGPAGNQAPALNLITPSEAFFGRTIPIQISGGGTAFAGTETIDFGDPGITVSQVTATSTDNLRALVAIGPSAKFGPHDVTVTSGSSSLKLTGGWNVKAPLKSNMSGSYPVQQGGLVPFDVLNLDYQATPLTSAFRLTSGLTTAIVQLTTMARQGGVGLADATAPVGGLSMQGTWIDPLGQTVVLASDPADTLGPTVTARTPTALTLGTPLAGQAHAAGLSSNLYQFTTTAADQILFGQFTALGSAYTGGTTTITAAYAGTDGKFGNGVLAPTTANGTANRTIWGYAPTAGANYLAAFPTNVQGGATYGYSVNVMSLTGVKFSAKEPGTPDSPGTPLYTIASLAAAGPNFATDGAVDMNGDYDYIRFTAAGGTSRLHVQVVSPGATAQIIEHSNGTCAASIGAGSGQNVAVYESAATPGTQRCIQISIFSAPKFPWPYRVIIAAR